MRRRKWEEMAVLIGILLLWEILSRLLQRKFLPGAFESVYSLIRRIGDGTLLPHLWASAYRILLGTFLGLCGAIPVGLFMGQKPLAERCLGTVFNVLYPIPKVVFLPVIVVCMGIGDMPKIFLIALVLFFQLTIVIRDAAKNISDELAQSMRSLGAGGIQYIWHLVLPACLPEIMTSVRSTLGVSTAMLFITENFASFTGLGYYITRCMDSRDYPDMYGGILMLGMLGAGLYWGIGLLEKKMCRWKILERSGAEQRVEETNG